MGVKIVVENFRSFEDALRVFKKVSKESLDLMKERAYYKKPSDIRRERINKAKRKRMLKQQQRGKDGNWDYEDKKGY